MTVEWGTGLPHEETSEPIIGYRVWSLDVDISGGSGSFTLCSLAVPYSWGPDTNCAYHMGANRPYCPDRGRACNVCGFWAFNEGHLNGLSHGSPVLGTVSLWGRIMVGTLGYRAEKAYPAHLVVIREYLEGRGRSGRLSLDVDADTVAQKLREKYKVEVEIVDVREEALALFRQWSQVTA